MRAVDWIDRNGDFMSRKVLRRTEKVEIYKRIEDRTCDKCGNPIDPDEIFNHERMAHELMVYLDPEECVNFRFRRDYCDLCLEHIWVGICELIGADPEDISGSSFDEEE